MKTIIGKDSRADEQLGSLRRPFNNGSALFGGGSEVLSNENIHVGLTTCTSSEKCSGHDKMELNVGSVLCSLTYFEQIAHVQ